MSPLLTLSRLIDRLSEFIGKWLAWLVLVAVLISAANAIVRKVFNTSSNAYLEIQWYLFAAVFLLAAGYTMLRQDHVKIDVISGRFSKRHADLDRDHRPGVLRLSAGLHRHPAVVAAGGSRLRDQRILAERGRPDPLAGVRLAAARVPAARHPGGVGADQAGRFPEGPCPRSDGEATGKDRRGGARRIPAAEGSRRGRRSEAAAGGKP